MKTKNWTIGSCMAAMLFLSIAVINAAEPEPEAEAAVDLAKLSKIPASGFTKLLNQSTSPDKKFAIAIGAKDGQPPKWVEDANDSYRMWEEAKTCNYLVAKVFAEVPKADEPPSVNVSVAARILQKENGELSVEIKKVEPAKAE